MVSVEPLKQEQIQRIWEALIAVASKEVPEQQAPHEKIIGLVVIATNDKKENITTILGEICLHCAMKSLLRVHMSPKIHEVDGVVTLVE